MNKNLVVNNNQIGDNHATFHELMQEKGKVIDELIMDRVNRAMVENQSYLYVVQLPNTIFKYFKIMIFILLILYLKE